VVAHRGSSHLQPEHTLAAYVAALDEGAEGLECDVRMTADGHLVCVHDRRVDRTANGHGLVSTMELAQLDVLSLRRLLETVADYDRPVDLAIETKHPTRYGGLVERRLVDLLETFGWAGKDSRVRVMSFSWKALNRVKKLAPELELVLLVDHPYSWKLSRNLIAEDWIAGPGIGLLREYPRVAARLKRSGRRIHVWTVNDAADLDLCLRLGAEAVISDKPAETLSRLGHIPAASRFVPPAVRE
jgi:glycerophosphoryl diester phosphodiesterase